MKILINRKPVEGPWGGGNLFVKALCEKLPIFGHEIVHQLCDDIDVIFIQDPRYSELGISINEIVAYKNWKPTTKIIHRVNECDARKETTDMDDLLRECSSHTTHTIFVSEWIRDYHLSKGWNCNNTSVIYNGVNKDHFHPVLAEHKLNNGKTNIVTHHWSSNRMKGFDIYEAIDEFVGKNSEKFTFTYIGRELGTFKNTTIIPSLFGRELGKQLGQYDVYVSGTKFDPGPNHILESLACEIPTYAYGIGGGAVEFVGTDHAFHFIEELFEILLMKNFEKNIFIPDVWDTCIHKIIELLKFNDLNCT